MYSIRAYIVKLQLGNVSLMTEKNLKSEIKKYKMIYKI